MQKYQNNVQTLDGRAIVGASVTVTEYPGGAPATVYNANGSGVITQPILTNGDGEFAFYAANGRYQLQITGGGISVAQTITDVILFDPSEAIDASEDAGDLAGDEFVPVSRGSGVLKTTLTAIAQWVIETYQGFTQAFTGAVARTLKSKHSDTLHIKDFGITGTGDETAKLTNALNAAFSAGKTLIVDVPVYVTKVTIPTGTGAVRCEGAGEFRPHASADQSDIYDSDLLEFGAGVSNSDFDVSFDMLGFSKSCMRVRGSSNRIRRVIGRNITGAVGRTKNLWVLATNGNDNEIDFASSVNCSNALATSAGATTVAVDGYGEDNKIKFVVADGGASIYLGNGKNTRIGIGVVNACTDNGIYVIEDSVGFRMETLIATDCPDEVCVFSGDTDSYVGRVAAKNCGRGVGVSNSVSPRVGTIDWYVDNPGANSGSPLFIRPIQTTQSNSLEVDELNIRGIWRNGAPIWTFDNGGIERVSIGRIRARLTYDDATATATKSLALSSAPMASLSIGEIDVTVTDGVGSLTSADIFRLNLPTGLTQQSRLGRIRLSNNGGLLTVRVTNPIQDVIRTDGFPTVRGDLNPPLFQNDDGQQPTRQFGAGAAPTQGTWRRGDIIWNQFPTASGFAGWICVTAGTPGTWKTFGAISA